MRTPRSSASSTPSCSGRCLIRTPIESWFSTNRLGRDRIIRSRYPIISTGEMTTPFSNISRRPIRNREISAVFPVVSPNASHARRSRAIFLTSLDCRRKSVAHLAKMKTKSVRRPSSSSAIVCGGGYLMQTPRCWGSRLLCTTRVSQLLVSCRRR